MDSVPESPRKDKGFLREKHGGGVGRGRRWGVWSRSWSFMRYFSSGQISPASSHLDGLRHNGQLATPALTGVTFLLPSLCPSRLLPCSLGMPLESTQHSIRASLACMSQDNKLEYSCDFALLPASDIKTSFIVSSAIFCWPHQAASYLIQEGDEQVFIMS